MKKIECYIQPYNLDTVAEAAGGRGRGRHVGRRGQGLRRAEGFTRGEDVKAGEFRFHPR